MCCDHLTCGSPTPLPRPGAVSAVSQTAHIPGTGATWAVGSFTSGSVVTPFIQVNGGW
jgi:hypothetical protein